MGLLLPMAVPLAYGALAAEGEVAGTSPILLSAIGGVLAGAIFGDHCSPISDTTVLSSQASGCDHVAHVRTQLPYALTIATVSVFFGTLPVGLGVPLWPCWTVGTVVLIAIVRFVGKRVEV
jgi:Na+/H+ antiporter NhaC